MRISQTRSFASLFALAAVMLPSHLLAQEVKSSAEAGKSTIIKATNGGTTDSATFGSLLPAFHIETDSDETNATLSLSFALSKPDVPHALPLKPTQIGFGTTTLNISATAPLGKNGKPSLFNFDNFGSDTSLKFGFSHYWGAVNFVPQNDLASNAIRDARLTSVCLAAAGEKLINNADDPAKTKAQFDALLATIEAYEETQQNASPQYALERATRSKVESIKTIAIAASKKCLDGFEGGELDGTRSLVSEYGTDEDQTASGDWDASGLWFGGGNFKISRTDYAFVDQLAFTKDEIGRTSYKLEAYAGHIFKGGEQSAVASFAYSRAYKSQDEVSICQPNGIGLQISCIEGPLGKPAKLERYILAAEFRRRFAVAALGANAIAIAPKISYELKSGDALFDLPIFFSPNKDNKLNGGLRLGYDTGKHDFGFGLFVGVPFSVFFN
jgi:hypothetical protein